MKKLFLFLTVVLVMIGLSGCDLISPTQVDEISEEYCRDNPTSEICQGDSVGDLTDQIVLNVFNTILDEYNDETNTTFCDDYFSITNTDLLDACRESREGLIPENYIGYTVAEDGVSKIPSLSTSDVYEITVISEDLLTEIVFTIGLVYVEGIMYINSWSYDVTTVEPQDLTVSLEDAQAYFQAFIDDYLDPTMSSFDLCSLYFNDRLADCIEERDESFGLGFDITLDAMTDQGDDVFEVQMSFSDTETTVPEIQFELLTFIYDEDGAIVMTFLHDTQSDEWLTAAEALAVIQKFLEDYADSEITNPQFNDLYFDGTMDEKFFDDRDKSFLEDATLGVASVDDPTEEPLEYLLVSMTRTVDGESDTMIISMRIRDFGGGRYYFDILFEDYDGLDYDDLYQFMLDLADDFQDTSLSDDYVCYLYFENESAEGCIDHRQQQLSEGVTLSLIGLYNIYDYFEVEFGYTDGVETWSEFNYARFYYNENDDLKVEFNSLGFDEISYDDAYTFMEKYYNLYVDHAITSHEVCSLFFEGYSYDECIMRREQEINDGIQLEGFDLYHDGYGFSVELYYFDGYENHFSKYIQAYFYYNHNGELKLEFFENFYLIPYDEAYPFIEQLINEFNDWSIPSDEICYFYFHEDAAMGCMEKRDSLMMDNIYIQLYMFDEEYDHYRIEFEYNDGQENYWYEIVHAYFWYDEFDQLKVDFQGEGHEEFPYEEAYNYVQQMLYDFADPGIPNEEFCTTYFPWEDSENCIWDRAILYDQLEHIDVSLEYMYYDGYVFEAKVVFNNQYTGEYWAHVVYLEFGWDEYDAIKMHIYYAPIFQFANFNESLGVIQQFLLDYMNPDVDFNEINAWYFDYQMDYQLEEERMYNFEFGREYILDEINDPYAMDGQEFLEVVIDVYENGVHVETMIAWMRVIILENGNHMIEMKDEGHNGYTEIGYNEALDFITWFTNDYSTRAMSSYEVCSHYFSDEEVPMCMVKRDTEMAEGIYVKLHFFEAIPEGYFAEFGYYNYNEEMLYSDYIQVFFYYGERGELKLSFDNRAYQKEFPYNEALMFVEQMFSDYLYGVIPSEAFCSFYGYVFPDCVAVRELVLYNLGYMYMTRLDHNYDNVFYLEFAYQDSEFGVPQYMGLEVAFFYDEYGNISIEVWNQGPDFYYATFPESIDIYTQYIDDYLNPMIPIEDIINTYFGGWMDEGFMDQRAQDLVSITDVEIIGFTDPYNGNGIDWINVILEITRYGEVEQIEENFRIIVYGPNLYQIEYEYLNPDMIDYATAYDFLYQYVIDIQDPDLDTDTFCNYYYADYLQEYCWAMRETILIMEYQVELADFYFDDYMYMYHATLRFVDPYNGTDSYSNYNVSYWYDNEGLLRLELFEIHTDWDPNYDQYKQFLANLVQDFNDRGLSDDYVCNLYFEGVAVDECIGKRHQLYNEGVSLELRDIYFVDNYYQVEFGYYDGSQSWTEYVYARFYYDNYNQLKVEFNDVGFNEINYDLAYIFLENLFNLYVEPTLTSHEVCSQFFEWYSYDECVMRREQEMMDGIQLVGFDLYSDGYAFSIDYHYQDSFGNGFTKHMNAFFYYNEYGALRLDLYEDFNLIPYEEVYPFIEQLIGEFNNWALLSEDVCELFFGPESVMGCIEKREELMMNNVYIQLWMLDVEYDHYRIEFEYNDGQGNYWYETVNAYFYYDEFNDLKVDFMGTGHEEFPYDEAYNYVTQMLYDFSDPNMMTDEFCITYFPWLETQNCIWDRAVLEEQLEHVEVYLNYMDYDGYTFKAEIVFNNHYTGMMWFEVVYLEFGYDEYGNIYMHIFEAPVTQYLNYNDSYTVIQQFIWDYMNQNVSFEEMNAWYFDYQMNYDFQDDRDEAFISGMNLVLFAIYDPYGADGQEYLEVMIDVYEYGVYVDTMISWMRVLPLSNGYHLIDIMEDDDQEYIDIDFGEAEAFMEVFINDYSNYNLNSYDVCNFYFSEEELPMCMVKRDALMMEGMYVMIHVFEETPDGFYADFGYYTLGDEFIYSEYTQVFFYYNERGELKLTFDNYNYQDTFPYDEALMYVENMLVDFMNPTISNDDFCNIYGQLFIDCHWARTEALNNDGYIYFSNFWHNFDNVFYFEYALDVSATGPVIYAGLEIAFYYDDFGNIMIDVWSQAPDFTYATYAEAQAIYTQFIIDYLDPAVSTEILVNTYFNGWMDQDFIDNRAQDLVSDISVSELTFTDPFNGDGIDWIHVIFEVTRYGDIEVVEENFRVIVYGEGYFELEFESFYPDAIDYPVAFDFFSDYVNNLLNPELTTEEFCALYTEYHAYDECMWQRDEMMSMYAYIHIVDFYFDEYIYSYRATLEYYDVDDLLMYTANLDVYFWYSDTGDLKLELFERHDYWDPLFDELYNIMMTFEAEYLEFTITSIDICNTYFMGDPACIEMRDNIISADQPLSVWVEDFYWYIDCDDEGYCSGDVLYEARIFYDFDDGSYIRQNVQVNPYYDEDGVLRVDFVVIEMAMSVPGEAVVLNAADTEAVLIQFAIDYSDPTIDSVTLCGLYFGGGINCMGGDRIEFLATGGTAEFLSMEEMLDYYDIVFYLADFLMITGEDTQINQAPFRVYEYGEEYYIEFVDYYLPVDPFEFGVASLVQALDMYLSFLTDYSNVTDYDDEYICQVYFQQYDPGFNCVEGRYDFVMAGGYTILLDIIEIEIVDGDNYFEVTLDQYDPFADETVTFTASFYALVTPEGNVFMLPIDPLE